jgi:hypothetical protein
MNTKINGYEDILNWISSDDPDKFSREKLQQIFQAGESDPISSILALAKLDVEEGEDPKSSNPIYLACYQFWYRALSINVKAVEQ